MCRYCCNYSLALNRGIVEFLIQHSKGSICAFRVYLAAAKRRKQDEEEKYKEDLLFKLLCNLLPHFLTHQPSPTDTLSLIRFHKTKQKKTRKRRHLSFYSIDFFFIQLSNLTQLFLIRFPLRGPPFRYQPTIFDDLIDQRCKTTMDDVRKSLFPPTLKRMLMKLQPQPSVASPMPSDSMANDSQDAFVEPIIQQLRTEEAHKREEARSSYPAYLRARLQYWKIAAKIARHARRREAKRNCSLRMQLDDMEIQNDQMQAHIVKENESRVRLGRTVAECQKQHDKLQLIADAMAEQLSKLKGRKEEKEL